MTTLVLPDVTVGIRDVPVPREAPTDVSTLHLVALAARGPLVPFEARSLSELTSVLGAKQTYTYWYDYARIAFAEGVARIVFSRAAPAAAATATVALPDGAGTPVTSLTATAVGPGADYNAATGGLAVDVDAGTADPTNGRVFSVFDGGALVEQSFEVATKADAIDWALNHSNLIRFTAGASTDMPAATVAALSLAGGSQTPSAAVQADFDAALARIDKKWGPGQVAMPDRFGIVAAHQSLQAHAVLLNRWPMLDCINTTVQPTLKAAADAVSGTANARRGFMFAQWAQVPGDVPDTTTWVPYSAIQAGLMAGLDPVLGPNEPAAGQRGISTTALALSAEFNDSDRAILNTAGLVVAINDWSGIQTYGYRTLANARTDSPWLWGSNGRFIMGLVARAKVVGQRYEWRQVDGRGIMLNQFAGDLRDECAKDYALGALFGATAGEAYKVDVGAAVNTLADLMNGIIHAVLTIHVSPPAERTQIQVVRVPLTIAI